MYSYKRIYKVLCNMTKDELGKAYCDLNCFRWDEKLLGKPPKNWKTMTENEKYKLVSYSKIFRIIKTFLSERERSMYWWTIELGNTKEEWERYENFIIRTRIIYNY